MRYCFQSVRFIWQRSNTRGGGSRNGFHEHECIRKFWEGGAALELRGETSTLRLFCFLIYLPGLRAETEPLGSDALSQLGRLMKVIGFQI